MLNQFNVLVSWIKARINDERGASLVEYALLVALIAVVCIAAVTFLGETASTQLSNVGTAIDGAN
ncbi:Flp family type IVb pilin [Actinomarinicola tropica]|uniref:Flp family type IVb pilin n=1 Tax=Actinomarinicola tropica TaxID=2789776 RepID=A0A5Q2RQJ9_9ACTN|nr:Flp family type IVb pilin [Actinomarinicola tropica]QGG95475.1 Flp family type IVb pilin [Actinomarinicola tropica]